MPKRDITEIMQPESKADKSVDRMRNLMGPEAKPKATRSKRLEKPSIKRTLSGKDPYKVLGVDEKSIDVILIALNAADPKPKPEYGPRSSIIGGLRAVFHWQIGAVEHHAVALARAAEATHKWPEDCPDPRQLCRVLLQQWYAQWGPELEDSLNMRPGT